MKAQVIYNFANEGGCSGSAMHDYFRSVFDGEPSPSGHENLPSADAKEFMRTNLYAMAHNSPSTVEECQRLAKKYKVANRGFIICEPEALARRLGL